ncbi:tripartite motif-containing 13 isoform X2 [Paramormyrops kingsleyae]|uniref:Tripartite motif containing 13 n=1 Tax=Paramormyrops kingsleyae TaxID=1676925 RepID=A0A3B3SST1_9TELE|nr:E3 ubiquitin-protein ligase TRIM13 isoform X2 [Paramormyrops kingsleyae]
MIAFCCDWGRREPMELLEEDLTCAICCCLYEDPRVLPCSHSFCKKCLEGILEGNRGPLWRPPFKCPTCRKETPHNGVNSLQVNYSLRGIVEKYNKIKIMPKMSLCRAHHGQPLNIFCATDCKLICGFCATTGDHKGHKFSALQEAYEQERVAFEELFRSFESWHSTDILSCLDSLETNKKKSLQAVSRDADRVTEYFDKLVKILEQKKNEILSDFETLKLMVMQAYDPEINRLRAVLEEQKRALNIAEAFREAPDPLYFLQQMQEFREKLKVIQETSVPSRTCMDVGPPLKTFDLKTWDSVRLKDVDKLAAPHENKARRVSATGCCRVLWALLMAACLFLCALFFLASLDLSCMSSVSHPYLPAANDLASYVTQRCSEAAAVFLVLFELLQKLAFDFLDMTVDFMCYYKLL